MQHAPATVALTGATGFIGRHLAVRLAAEGWRVRALARRQAEDLRRAGIEIVPGSLEDADSLRTLLRGADAVVHAAGLTSAVRAADFHRVNAEATARLASLCGEPGAPRRFLLLSSLAARHPDLSDYALSKRRAEQALAESPLDWTALRPPAVYGPGDPATLQIFRLLKRGILPVPPDPAARLSMIYVEDLCGAVAALLANPNGARTAPGADSNADPGDMWGDMWGDAWGAVRGAAWEVRDACESGYGWQDIAAAGGRYFGRDVRCIPVPKPLLWLAGHMSVLKYQLTRDPPRFSPGKVRELCHIDWVCRGNPLADLTRWRPRVGIEEGFRRTLDWYREKRWL